MIKMRRGIEIKFKAAAQVGRPTASTHVQELIGFPALVKN